MNRILNITNGDSAVNTMKEADIPGVFLPWRDILHEGPVPEGRQLEELSQIRAQFITKQGWGKPEDIENSFKERDNTLRSYEEYKKIRLWFEHDLYDQLQILQILDWFSRRSSINSELSIICTDRYLGQISAKEMTGLLQHEEPITKKHLELSRRAWDAFRSKTPEKWYNLLQTDTSPLPFLQDAIIRMSEEYPCCSNGLSRTAQQALKIVSQGEQRPGKLFQFYQKTEERKFLGDLSFWTILNELLESSPPLLKIAKGKRVTPPVNPDQTLSITPMGRKVYEKKENWLTIVSLDRWIGGVHLTPDTLWCWDRTSGSLVKKS